MLTIENKTIYKCEFCAKHSMFKHIISRHEKRCKNNPINQHSCFSCAYLKKEVESIVSEYGSNRITHFFCTKKDIEMKTYKVVNSYRLDNFYGQLELMPNDCHLQSEIDEDNFIDIKDLFN